MKTSKTENRRMKRALLIRNDEVKDFERAAEEANWDPEKLRKIITDTLASAVVKGKPSNVAREAELIAKMKDVDMFVRNSETQQASVLSVLMDPDFDNCPAVKALPLYRTVKCTWCGEEFEGDGTEEGSGLAQLQEHTLVCPKRPITGQKEDGGGNG